MSVKYYFYRIIFSLLNLLKYIYSDINLNFIVFSEFDLYRNKIYLKWVNHIYIKKSIFYVSLVPLYVLINHSLFK